MGSKVSRFVAAASLIAAIVAVWPAVGILRATRDGFDLRLLWVLVPILSPAGVLGAVRRPNWAPVWALTGASCGFVILAAWSFGLFFAPSALLLLVASAAHLTSVRPTWQALLIPFWFAAGATTLCVLFVLRDLAASSGGVTITESPVIVAGAWIAAGLWRSWPSQRCRRFCTAGTRTIRP